MKKSRYEYFKNYQNHSNYAITFVLAVHTQHDNLLSSRKFENMSQSQEILEELAAMVVKATNENRALSPQENAYFERMFERALEISSLDNEN